MSSHGPQPDRSPRTPLTDRRRCRVLVTDAETRAALAAIRGLADDGFEVVAAAGPVRPAVGQWSRGVSQRVATPDPVADEAGFVDALVQITRAAQPTLLMPGSDASLRNISRARARLEPLTRLGLPDSDSVERSLDKVALDTAARRHGLDPPQTAVCTDLAQARAAAREFGYPLVVKPLRSVIEGGAPIRLPAALVDGEPQLTAAVAEMAGTVLVQRRLDAHIVSFAGVHAHGSLLGEAVSRYHRTWRPVAGNACFSETIDVTDDLREQVRGVLGELGWEGLFELELLQTAQGTLHAIDLNPRPYGSMALALGAGVNLPAIWGRHALGEPVAAARARSGVFYRWTDADLRYSFWQFRRGDMRSAARALNVRHDTVHPFMQADDRGPGMARILEMSTHALKNGNSRARGNGDSEPTVIVGAGPNGLAVASHLQHLGVQTRSFGEPMEAWVKTMPTGMLLRSRWRSSHISSPGQSLSLDAYQTDQGRDINTPQITRENFVDYGRWFQSRAVPGLDERKVTSLAKDNGGFRVGLQDGEEIRAARVVIAAGLSPFVHRPAPFDALSPEACTHAYDHDDLGKFAGKRVAVIGAGQSAREYAALLHEAGADTSILCRAQELNWLPPEGGNGRATDQRPRIGRDVPPTDVGGPVCGWIAAMPDVFRLTPPATHETISFRCIKPIGADWLRHRLTDVPFTMGVLVTAATQRDDGTVQLTLSDHTTREVDHVLLGTGYHVDVRRYPFLAPELAQQIKLDHGYPVLKTGLESASVPGLHFMGAAAARSFGPIMRFVVGTWYSAPSVARRIAGERRTPLRFAFPDGRS